MRTGGYTAGPARDPDTGFFSWVEPPPYGCELFIPTTQAAHVSATLTAHTS